MRLRLASVACRASCSGQPVLGGDNEAGIKRRRKIRALGGKADSLSDGGRQRDWREKLGKDCGTVLSEGEALGPAETSIKVEGNVVLQAAEIITSQTRACSCDDFERGCASYRFCSRCSIG